MKYDIYIASIDRRISMKEFESHMPKVGHAYKLNPHFFNKCIGYKGDTPIMEGLFVANNVNNGHYQLHLYPNVIPDPSLDFVNGMLSGRYVEVDVAEYDRIVTAFKNSSEMLEEMCKNIT